MAGEAGEITAEVQGAKPGQKVLGFEIIKKGLNEPVLFVEGSEEKTFNSTVQLLANREAEANPRKGKVVQDALQVLC